MTLKYVEINRDNILLATKVQMEIFPGESGYEHFRLAIKGHNPLTKYYLVYDGDNVIGITGLYSRENVYLSHSIWLGWFGVLKQYRRHGYGKQVLYDTMDMAKSLMTKYPIKYFRLYTSSNDNASAIPLYDKTMDIKEDYTNIDDVTYDDSCLIYTKVLGDYEHIKWNNQYLNLNEVVKEQEVGNLLFE
ncbi:MAG TPA: GNAT family N-acetyltransferase [Bacilli bacterium]|jgi:GNAT superfamily N-acetyltransferase|nr:GNAT family N-acetyltransferase [Bacilli bacterium]HPZ23770.1 GNAT family N-acetyltransferase [Bacilli bacterium]HQC83475.1 GNAT family N-acetyltransferase [Bacilli bacterium]